MSQGVPRRPPPAPAALVRFETAAEATLAQIPALFAPDPKAARHFLEFFAANIRNPNTRRAYFSDHPAVCRLVRSSGVR
jgi:hypothetical protein